MKTLFRKIRKEIQSIQDNVRNNQQWEQAEKLKKTFEELINHYNMEKTKDCCVNATCSAELMDQISFIYGDNN